MSTRSNVSCMSKQSLLTQTILTLVVTVAFAGDCAAQHVYKLWPTRPPGDETIELPPEADTSGPNSRKVAGQPVLRLGNVSEPSLTVYLPSQVRQTKTAIMIAPGGGYNILAWDLEGTEVAKKLNELGITAILLKYRVPKRPNREAWEPPLQDAQRAMGIIRKNASQWGIRPDRIGVLGFSAGGHLCAMISTHWQQRLYSRIDSADEYSCRPDFTVLIYPAYLVSQPGLITLSQQIKVDSQTPPAFVVMAMDDPIGPENALAYCWELKRAGVPVELHLYQCGGHGFGLRPTASPVTQWPRLLAQWLGTNGWLDGLARSEE